MIYSIIVLVGFERHIINSCDSDLCFVPETHYFNLLPMKRRQVLLSNDGRKLKRIHAEGATPKTSQRTINCNTTCSIGKIAQQETTCVPVAQVTDASVDLDSAANK